MRTEKVVGLVVAGLVIACVAFVVLLVLIKALWAWTVPDLFPGAVESGLVADTISWAAAAKLAIILAVLSALGGGHTVHKKKPADTPTPPEH
jgi:hypothetical protein